MKPTFLLYLFLSFGFIQSVFPQKAWLDSLESVWHDTNQTDQARLRAINTLAVEYNGYIPDSAIYYAEMQLDFAEKSGSDKFAAKALRALGLGTKDKGNYDQALVYLTRSLELNKKLNNPEGIAGGTINLGIVYADQGNKEKAIDLYFEGLKLSEKAGIIAYKANALNNIGGLYLEQGDYTQAIDYFNQAMAVYEKLDNHNMVAMVLNNIGNIYGEKKENEKALDYYQRSLNISEKTGNDYIKGLAQYNLGAIYIIQKEYEKAREYLNGNLSTARKIGDTRNEGYTLMQLAEGALGEKDFNNALIFGKKTLDLGREMGDPEIIKLSAHLLGRVNQGMGKASQAIDFYFLYDKYRDSTENNELNNRLLRQENQYKREKEALADSLIYVQQQNEIRVNFEKELAQMNYLLIGGFALALIGFLVFRYWQQQKIREKELLQERERIQRLEQIDKLKDQFLANTSHELRTPLQGIIGLSESLHDRSKDVMDQEDLAMIVSSGKRLSNLVNDILDFSKLKNYDIQLNQKPLDLYTMVNVILKYNAPLIKGKDLKLINEVPNDLPAAFADEDRLQQILYNLIGNGIKFTEKGTVRVKAYEKEGQLEIAISDTGIGISEDKKEIIFLDFEQGDGSSERSFAGTGLGLSISTKLIEQHGGKLWMKSKEGEGSTFFFTLPISPEKGENLTENIKLKLEHAQLTPLASTLNKEISNVAIISNDALRILIVDDEPINHQVLKNFLRDERYQVVSAMNGHEALEILETKSAFDLVLLDVMMPKMSGYQVCQKIREKHLPSELPIIMVTAKNQIHDLVEGLKTGANDYLAKPFSKDEFLARLTTHINLHSINRVTNRFVPTEFIHTLGKNTITEVSLGDHISRDVTVFFSDIRGYTTLAEQMNPTENFHFVNAYSGRMGPSIRKNNGFVNQFLGDGIMALFQQNPSDALQAAIDMQAELRKYNQDRALKNRLPIEVGMGFHTGKLIMGIIGDKQRADAAIISDTVNTAARVEGLTKYYRAKILLSSTSYQDISEAQKKHCRFLGLVLLKGKKEPLGIYESFDGEGEEIRGLKLETQLDFKTGIDAFLKGEFTIAASAFDSVLSKNNADDTARRFLNRIEKLSDSGLANEWNGIEKMDDK